MGSDCSNMVKKFLIFLVLAIIPVSLFFYSKDTPSDLNVPVDTWEYRDAQYPFSFEYQNEFMYERYEEAEGETLVFIDSEQKKEFQIFITPFTEEYISEERFRLDVPSGVIKDKQDVLVGGVQGTIFFSENSFLGGTRELWFIHNGFLYEITTYDELDSWLADIMKTWRFL